MKAFGISALTFSIIAIFLPIVGVFMTGLSGILSMFSAGRNTALGLAAVIINITNLIFLSPSILVGTSLESSESSFSSETSFISMFGALLLIQIVAILVFASVWLKSILRSREQQAYQDQPQKNIIEKVHTTEKRVDSRKDNEPPKDDDSRWMPPN